MVLSNIVDWSDPYRLLSGGGIPIDKSSIVIGLLRLPIILGRIHRSFIQGLKMIRSNMPPGVSFRLLLFDLGLH